METSVFVPTKTVTVRTVTATDHLVSEEENWFPQACRTLVPNDAGLTLHYVTGFEERTCYRYAAGDRKPPAYFLRALLRSEHGWQWLAVLMDGAEPQWWRDIQRARIDAQKAREFVALFKE